MAEDYRAQLLEVEVRLAKDPDNAELLELKSELEEIIELEGSGDEGEMEKGGNISTSQSTSHSSPHKKIDTHATSQGDHNKRHKTADLDSRRRTNTESPSDQTTSASGANQKRQPSEAELLSKKKEKARKKKLKYREKREEEANTAEIVQQTWQSFAKQKGLKGVTKRSIFASPHSITGKVGVGTNGIADAPSASARVGGASSSAPTSSASSSSAPMTARAGARYPR